MVEFAIVLPLLLTIVFGIIEFGVILYDKAVITNASREGARYGILYASPGRMTTGQISQKVLDYCGSNLISLKGTPAPVPAVSAACATSGQPITVTVTYSYNFLVLPNFVTGLTGPLNLTAVTTMRCE